MRRWFLGLLLTGMVLSSLWGCGAQSDVRDSNDTPVPVQQTDYFRDCETFDAKCNQICYAELPWADSLSFCEQEERLREENAIPQMDDYEQFDASAYYDEAGEADRISLCWSTQALGEYARLSVNIYRQMTEQGERMDGFYYDLGGSVTETQVDGVTVFGVYEEKQDGAPLFDSCLLETTFSDGSVCQIEGVGDTCREDATAAMNFLLQNSIRYDAFVKELGDRYTWASLKEYPELFQGCIPDFSGLPLYYNENQKPIRLKNGVPTEDSMEFALEYLELKDPYIQWAVFREPMEYWMEFYVGQLELLTDVQLGEQLEENQICFQAGGYYVSVNFGKGIPAAVVAALIERLPGYSSEPESTDVAAFLEQDDALSGERLYGCGTGKVLYSFSGQIGSLLSENAIPVVHGYYTPEIYGEYDMEGQLSELSMNWTAREGTGMIDLSISPEHIQGVRTYYDGTTETMTGTELTAPYSVDTQDCVTMEIGGVTVYGDGTPDSEHQALFWQMPDGTLCQLYLEQITDFTPVGEILDLILTQGINRDAFAKSRGKMLVSDMISEEDTQFRAYAPKELWENSGIKNTLSAGEKVSKVFLVYETRNRIQFTWQILFQPTEQDVANCLGWFDDFTKEDLENAIARDGDSAGFWYLDGYIRLYAHRADSVDTMWNMVEELRKQVT